MRTTNLFITYTVIIDNTFMHPALIVVKKTTATARLFTPGYCTECICADKYNLIDFILSIINSRNNRFFKETGSPQLLANAYCNNITRKAYLNAYQQSIIYNNPNDQPIKKQGV